MSPTIGDIDMRVIETVSLQEQDLKRVHELFDLVLQPGQSCVS